MQKKYNCTHCNYVTDRLSNIKNHNKSQKHLANISISSNIPLRSPKVPNLQKKINDKNIKSNIGTHLYSCIFCMTTFRQSGHKSRHEKLCYKKKLIEKEKEFNEKINNNNQNFNNELITLKCEIKKANEKNKIYENTINDLKNK